jgi:hypothetical protein
MLARLGFGAEGLGSSSLAAMLGTGLAAMLVGTLWWAGIGPSARSPLVLIVFGSITLVNGISLWLTSQGPARRAWTRRVAASPPILALRRWRAARGAPVGSRPTSAVSPLASRAVPGPPASIASPESVPGGTIWNHLLPASPGELPAELVGPIPECAFDPDQDLELGTTPPLAVSATSPETLASPAAPAVIESWRGAGAFGSPTSQDAPSPFEPTSWLEMEALMAAPPHLRPPGSGPVPPPAPAPIQPTLSGTAGSACATCASSMTDPETWHRCTHCRRPLCVECILETLKTSGRGWCSNCSAMEPAADARMIA